MKSVLIQILWITIYIVIWTEYQACDMLKMSGDVILIFFECNAIYVEDVKDRSNTPKGCNAMYVEDVKDGKRIYTHILAHNFLNI